MYKKASEFTRRIAETRKESEKKEGGGYKGEHLPCRARSDQGWKDAKTGGGGSN